MSSNYRYVVDYDPEPDLSYLADQPEFAETVVSYMVTQQKRCEHCGEWSTEDVLGGCDVVEGHDDDIGPGTYSLAELPEFMREHFYESL